MNTRRLVLPLLAIMLVTAGAAAQDLVIRGGWLFDSVRDDVVPNRGLVIGGGKLLEVGADLDGRDLADATVIDLGDDDYIAPGIFDLHSHYNIRVLGMPRIDQTEHYSVIYLANGCTSTFPAGEYNPREMLEMRRRIDRDEQIGPRVYNSGPYFGRVGMRRGATPEDVYAQVDEWAELGARGFKAKSIDPVQLQALIERAHLHGLTVTAHLGSGFRGSTNPKDAVLMGIDRVEHFLGGDLLPDSQPAYTSLRSVSEADLDTDAFREIVQLYLDRGVFFDATITAYGYFGADDEVYEQWTDESKYLTPVIREWRSEQSPPQGMEQFVDIYHVKHLTVKRFFDAGGRITLGTDHVSDGKYLAGFAAHRELHAFVRAGIPPAAALKIATINGARALNVADKLGTIEAGKFADLFVMKGNPLDDIRNTRNVHTVVKAGRVYRTADLLASVEGKLGPAKTP